MSGPGGPDRSLATSFGSAAEAYERGRPAYPADLLDALHHELDLGPGRDLLDLAAGTGKLTRQLVPFGAHLVAVEPLAEMRARFEHAVPGVLAIDGTAEDIPLAADSIDIVLVAQAYHWFDRDRANREVARVLRPGGQRAAIDHVGRVIAAFDEPFAVPYRTEAVWWRRTSEPVDE